MEPYVALLDASHGNPNTLRNFRRELDGDVRRFSIVDREFPDVTAIDAVVITGSRASVYWDEPWIKETREWVRTALDQELPTLGICWGHQLLADALGGDVEPMGEYELGYRTVRHRGAGIFKGVPEEFTVFTTHSDAVTELPEGAKLIAKNDYGIHGFRCGSAHGIQAHPEYDPETAESVVRDKDLPKERIESVCAGISEEVYSEAKAAKAIFKNFSRRVEASISERTAAD